MLALIVSPAYAAPPVIDAVSTGTTNGGSSITISHTTSGVDRLMLVGVSINNDRNEVVTSVTYNGVNLTLVGVAEEADDARIEIWRLVAPPTGTFNVVVTFDQALQRQAIAGVMTFTAVDQVTPLRTFAGANATSGTASVNVGSAIGELVFGVVAAETPGSLTPGAGQTEHWNVIVGGGGRTAGAGSTQAGASTVTASWTLGSSDHWAIGGVSVRPAVPLSGLLAYYAMDELSWNGTPNEVQDSSGNGLHGVRVGSAQTVDPAPPTPPGTCRAGDIPFNNSDAAQDAVDTGIDLDSGVGNRGTVDFWYKSNTAWIGGGDRQLIDASTTADNKYFFLVLLNNGALRFRLEDSADGDHELNSAPFTFAADTWVHIAITWDLPGNRMQVFVNAGAPTAITPNTTGAFGELGTIYIGDNRSTYHPSGTANSANGAIDEVRVYNTALDQTAVQADMNAGHPCPSLQLAYYAMDELAWNGTAGEVQDSSGNGNHGVRVGSAQTVDPLPPTPPGTCRAGNIPLDTSNASHAVSTPLDVDGDIGNRGTIDFWYKHNARWNDGSNRTLLDATLDSGGDNDFYLIKEGNGRLRFEVERANGGDITLRTSGNNFPANEWHHVAITWDFAAGRMRVYIDGVLEAERTGAAIVPLNYDTLYIGDNRSTSNAETRNSANGNIDEVYVYRFEADAATIQADMNRSHPCPGALSHFAIVHDGFGINCQAEPVTIVAHDAAHNPLVIGSGTPVSVSLSTSTNHGDWVSVISGNGVLTNLGNGQATYTFTNESTVTLALKNTFVDTTNINVAGGGAAEDPTEDPNLVFDEAGFNFLANGAASAIGLQIAGKPSNVAPDIQVLELQAIRTNDSTGACEAALQGVNTIDLAFECENPTTCTARQVNINGTNIAGNNAGASPLTYTGVSLDFGDATDTTATFVMAYPDAGRIQLHARYNIPLGSGAPSGNLMLGASNEFVVRPFAFDVAITGNPAATNPGGPVFTQAGANFTTNVRAVLWEAADDSNNDGIADNHNDTNPANNANLADNLAALNYGREIAVEQVTLGSLLDQPQPGGTDPGLAGGTTIGGFVNGAGSTATARYDEVGIIEINATVADTDYLGIGAAATANIAGRSGYVGRFIPDRLQVTANTPVFRHATDPWACGFTYLEQEFSYGLGTEPVLTVTALNSLGGRTDNYDGVFWKLATGLTNRVYADAAGTGAALSWTTNGGAATFNGGVVFDGTGTFTITGDGLTYTKPLMPEAPFDALVDLISPVGDLTDTDGVCHDPDDNGVCDSFQISGITGTQLRFGRLRIENAFGSELLALPVPTYSQYFQNTATGFVVNTDDNCTSIAAGDVQITAAVGPITPADTSLIVEADPFQNGKWDQAVAPFARSRLTAPNVEGSLDLRVDLTAASQRWLRFDWDSDGAHDDDPVGRATFGIYRGSPRHIYLRELY